MVKREWGNGGKRKKRVTGEQMGANKFSFNSANPNPQILGLIPNRESANY
jgi:hypothetical protein